MLYRNEVSYKAKKTKGVATPIRNYKDSVFRMLFSEKPPLLSMYNALNGTDYTNPEELEININKGYNEELKKRCRDLYGYMVYVDKVREYAKDHPLEKAVELAITYCIRNDILAEFLSKRRAEVMSMSIFEYNQEQHFRQIAEENQAVGWEKGRQAGRAEGREEGREIATLTALRSLIANTDWSVEKAMGSLGIPDEEREKYKGLLKT